jgi:hypothetical protein
MTRRDWLAVLRFGAWVAMLASAASGIALADELRRTRAAHLPTAWLTGALLACLVLLALSVVGAIATGRDA